MCSSSASPALALDFTEGASGVMRSIPGPRLVMLFSGVTCRKHEIQKAVGKKDYSEATRKLQQERKQQES